MNGEDEILVLIERMSELANLRDVDGLMALHHFEETVFCSEKRQHTKEIAGIAPKAMLPCVANSVMNLYH